MTYKVTITSSSGDKHAYACGGATDEEALIYAGKVVEDKADDDDPNAKVSITRDGNEIGQNSTIADMLGTKG